MDFRKIILGKADAQEESVEYPQLLKNGYYDNDNVVNQVCSSSKFLVLGYKGSGKSALSEHIKLSMENRIVVGQQSLKDFPYKSFAKIVAGDGEQEYKLKVAWRWLLLVQILHAYIQDPDAKFSSESKIDKVADFMTQSGIFPLVNLSALVSKTSTKSFKGCVQTFSCEMTTKTENAQISFEWLIDYVKGTIANCVEQHQYILIIDGLDDILTSREIQYTSIAALINEAKDLNVYFRKNEIPCKIVVLCRTDIFERLPDANKNKIRRDCSYVFNWYQEGVDDQKHCGLIDILNMRGKLVYPEMIDVIETFFPAKYHGNDIYSSLLDLTRHTPRDFMQLLISIQNHCKKETVSVQTITEGIKEYSTDYFLPEIKDEMAGYIPFPIIDIVTNVLSSLREREFSYEDFCRVFSNNCDKDVRPDIVLNVLYDCSAIGHAYKYRGGQETRVTFKYRNRNSSFNSSDRIILHKGLWKALNVNY